MTLQIPFLSRTATPIVLLLLTLSGTPGSLALPDPDPLQSRTIHTFNIVEGQVLHLNWIEGEDGLPIRSAVIVDGDRQLRISLAPASVLDQTGFTLETGDRLTVRLFSAAADGPAQVQKAMNRTSGVSVRLRSIHGEPLWDGNGRWHGVCPVNHASSLASN